jgi:hypothetical protein
VVNKTLGTPASNQNRLLGKICRHVTKLRVRRSRPRAELWDRAFRSHGDRAILVRIRQQQQLLDLIVSKFPCLLELLRMEIEPDKSQAGARKLLSAGCSLMNACLRIGENQPRRQNVDFTAHTSTVRPRPHGSRAPPPPRTLRLGLGASTGVVLGSECRF